MLRVRAAVCRSWRRFQTSSCAAVEVKNEPILGFTEGSSERKELLQVLNSLKGATEEIPCVVGDEHVWTKDIRYQLSPFNHSHKVAKFCYADKELINKAIEASVAARREWDLKPVQDRAQVLFKAADIISGPKRAEVLAKTMIGQGKTVVQAEIDAAAELIDFFRFNAKHAIELQNQQPLDAAESTNTMLYRGLEGFVAAVAPFNFTAIGGNLAGTPAVMGNVVLWKPSDTAMSASYAVYRVLRESGLPPNIIQFLPADGPVFGDAVTSSEHLAGINFTGSVPTFKRLWKQVAQNVDTYRTFPRLAGECGGKNFHFVHSSADIQSVVMGTIRSAFEFGGQKCSACSRMYVPDSLWPQIRQKMVDVLRDVRVGDVSGQTGGQRDRQTGSQRDRQIGRQTYRQKDRQTGGQRDSQTGGQRDSQTGSQRDRQIGRQTYRQKDRQTGGQRDRKTDGVFFQQSGDFRVHHLVKH
ncbi:delta-1-pyrroline-5-carboxylate dehydrogenase, mitochondrial isoform X2 [Acanthochromis polyacanthus]|uniref:delta-1-pyrroline-5-carboxylate dehydrogenase, mitochondrial isoform X2 n=1 Tax=Acanthochromis polyacanthus TaxID=80966 RepID=UPI0022340674|nr:delta-1-pyrroline-5-carboxylate dehydrogenase, mitochondrial isoform X2 [Acanthochromis polyacanthus]